MNILIIGANGFIGRHIVAACRAEQHRVVRAARSGADADLVCDLEQDCAVAVWRPRLQGIDAVINCVGLLRHSAAALQAVHCDAPAAIAAACAERHLPFVHVSVLGLDHAADTDYFRTKRAGEAAIRAAYPGAVIVRPSVVFGLDSPATRLMLRQSRLPVFVLPTDTQPVAPIHVDDLARLCVCVVGTLRAAGCDVDCVGETEMSLAEYMQALRRSEGSAPARVLHIPNRWMRAALSASAALGAKTLTPEALDLMEHAHTGNRHAFTRWMHQAPRPVAAFQRA